MPLEKPLTKMPQQINQEKIDFVLAKGERIKKECAEQYNRLDVFICMAKRIPTLYEKSGLEHSDLFALYWAKVLVLAEKRLNRKITNIEFQSREQQLRLWITEKQRERDRRDALVRIQDANAQAQMRAAQAQERSNTLQIYQGILRQNQPRQPINCYHRGNQTSCW